MRLSGLGPSAPCRALTLAVTVAVTVAVAVPPTSAAPAPATDRASPPRALFAELEELARVVDIAYCVGTTGIAPPFLCAGRCADFPAFELVDTFNTGPLMSDSCGYVALDHGAGGRDSGSGRVVVAFRGTYSIANTIVDLSTVPQEYVPYPGPEGAGAGRECRDCTVHSGFWASWRNTRELVLPHLFRLRAEHPSYGVHLVGHSLGGAVAALAGLELDAGGFAPVVTTFGEPRIGNVGLRAFVDEVFGRGGDRGDRGWDGDRYRRVTHVDDPVPLLPLSEWGYRSHAGELFIAKPELQPGREDVKVCLGDEDAECSAGGEAGEGKLGERTHARLARAAEAYHAELQTHARARAGDGNDRGNGTTNMDTNGHDEQGGASGTRWGIPLPARYKLWQLFFAHRDYFWRLGLCVPGGDPLDWGRDKYRFGDGEGGEVRAEL
ncbi:unnamed protein product [Diplocarpon coronariae]